MKANLERLGGLVFSQRVLLALTQAGVSREDAYRLVQTNAMATWQEGGSFLERLKADPEVAAKLIAGRLEAIFDYGFYTRHAQAVIDRVLTGA